MLPTHPFLKPLALQEKCTTYYSTTASFTTSSNTELENHLSIRSSSAIPSYPSAGASIFIVIDVCPHRNNEGGLMHRTRTLDYVYMIDGELELELDGGEKRVLKKGEFVIQACMHNWKNPSNTEGAGTLVTSLGSEGAVEGRRNSRLKAECFSKDSSLQGKAVLVKTSGQLDNPNGKFSGHFVDETDRKIFEPYWHRPAV